MKKIVHFTKAEIFTHPILGKNYAVVWPTDHPDHLRVSNGKPADTSEVIDIVKNSEGTIVEFETLNTQYIRVE